MAANKDFYTTALTSLTNQIATYQSSTNDNSNISSTSFNPNAYAQSLVEDDHPKIDSAIKSYLSLVAARSCTVSEMDVLEVSSYKLLESSQGNAATSTMNNNKRVNKCIFMEDANRSSLLCARALLSGMNSTMVPEFPLPNTNHTSNENKSQEKDDDEKELKRNVVRILWNGLVQSSSSAKNTSKEKKKQLKPSKLLGREALLVVYPFVQERFRRGVSQVQKEADTETKTAESNECPSSPPEDLLHSIPNEQLQPIPPPANIDLTQWETYYNEFGQLLSQACSNSSQQEKVIEDDDSKLLWSADGGRGELKERRERRSQRAEDALGEEKSGSGAATVDE